MDEEIYKENILDHYKHPRGKRAMEHPTAVGKGVNANCGDSVVLYLALAEGRVRDVSFEGEGCAISQAATSMLAEKLRGMELEAVRMLAPGDIYSMLGIRISPGRANCALLSYEALNQALKHVNA